uniref:Uncharacterized protein n=1 Tax=Oryza punctata TaxID=4537 RepID=A0A0E0JXG6_ORYPU
MAPSTGRKMASLQTGPTCQWPHRFHLPLAFLRFYPSPFFSIPLRRHPPPATATATAEAFARRGGGADPPWPCGSCGALARLRSFRTKSSGLHLIPHSNAFMVAVSDILVVTAHVKNCWGV